MPFRRTDIKVQTPRAQFSSSFFPARVCFEGQDDLLYFFFSLPFLSFPSRAQARGEYLRIEEKKDSPVFLLLSPSQRYSIEEAPFFSFPFGKARGRSRELGFPVLLFLFGNP